MPTERPLDEAEHQELQTAAMACMKAMDLELSEPVAAIQALQERILVRRLLPGSHDDEAFSLGALYAALLEMTLGWELVEVTWEQGLVALAVCEMDRSVVLLPVQTVSLLFAETDRVPTLVSDFERLHAGQRPPGGKRGQYAVLQP